ncbi:GNAT family N-acetyltransferase [Pseudomonas stutzeri]|uniref:NTP pyrophosphohydrolase n=1 Tax=Stutzerimonas stutzeri TaxID=316 RepID=A0A2N8S2Z8_STUST|nr:GNAT family N-acetyltransferase [Stutzerimonas stutzeri]MCQ4296563.1 GNAT family N-acetyltransferase [Stutzerimonas stutzeri]PNF80994.1 NTP pyrophosphohydrolase [Stutzerimonas stutzeri]
MPAIDYTQLPEALRPLLVRFYRDHNSRNRVRPEATCWVARRGDIVAGLCLTPVAHGHFLTGLLVSPSMRTRGVGTQLVRRALDATLGPVWLFCKPELLEFYTRLGFKLTSQLPEPLADRLSRYKRTKTLLALVIERRMLPMPIATLTIAIACLFDESDRLLVVRKRGTRFFMLPGGKAEAGETPLETLRRELHEELDLRFENEAFEPLGHFRAAAANEPDHQVEADVFIARLRHTVKVQAELEELEWLALAPCTREDIAPLLCRHVMPALLARAAEAGIPACRLPGSG